MECHRCEHNGKRHRACLSCRQTHSDRGVTLVSLEAMGDAVGGNVPSEELREEWVPELSASEMAERMQDFLSRLLGLTLVEMVAVWSQVSCNGEGTFRAIASMLSVSTQRAWAAYSSAIERVPELAFVASGKRQKSRCAVEKAGIRGASEGARRRGEREVKQSNL